MPFDLVAEVTCFLRVLRQLEGIAHHPVAAAPGEHRLLHRHLVFGAAIEPAADFRIFALVVFAHDIEIDVARRAALQWRIDPGEQPHRAQVDVLLKAAPQRDQEAPQRHMVGHVGMADGAEKDRIEQPQPVEPVGRHHLTGLDIGLAAPVEFAPFEREAKAPGRPLHHRNAFRHHFAPDAVAGDDRDPIAVCHVRFLLCERPIVRPLPLADNKICPQPARLALAPAARRNPPPSRPARGVVTSRPIG